MVVVVVMRMMRGSLLPPRALHGISCSFFRRLVILGVVVVVVVMVVM